jgi:hypothetical protein
MKKLLMITLSLLLFTFLISPVQAKRPGPLDRPLPDYNNLTLRQIFEDGQLLSVASMNVEIGIAKLGETLIINTTTNRAFSQNVGIVTVGHKYYYKYIVSSYTQVHETDGYILRSTGMFGIYSLVSKPNGSYSYILSATQDTDFIAVTLSVGYNATLSGFVLINLTALGIPTATKIEMDNLYLDYLKYKDMMNATDVMLIVGQLVAFVWSLIVSFEIFGFVLWEYALFGIGAGFIGYLALKIIQKKAGDDNGDSD